MSGIDNAVIKLAFSRVILVKILQILRLYFLPSVTCTAVCTPVLPGSGESDPAFMRSHKQTNRNTLVLVLGGRVTSYSRQGAGGHLTSQDPHHWRQLHPAVLYCYSLLSAAPDWHLSPTPSLTLISFCSQTTLMDVYSDTNFFSRPTIVSPS